MIKENKKFKDSIFRYLFKEKKNFIILYKWLTGVELADEDVEFFDTSSILYSKELRNDISYLIKQNILFILIEHQSTINQNMAIRLWLYYSELIKIYIKMKELNVFSTEPIKIPAPFFCVVYNGNEPQDDYILEIKKNFIYDTEDLNVKVRVININYDKIKTKDEKNNFVGYSFFVYMMKESLNKGLTYSKAFKKAKSECLKNDLLIDYLNRKEFVDMAIEMYTIEQEIQDAIEGAAKKARAEGWEKGKEEGKEEGRKEGRKEAEIKSKNEMTRNLLLIGMDMIDIMKVTSLQKSEIIQLKEDLDTLNVKN